MKEILNISDRIYDLNSAPDIHLIETPLNLNKTLLKYFKKKSIAFLKKNLNFNIFWIIYKTTQRNVIVLSYI